MRLLAASLLVLVAGEGLAQDVPPPSALELPLGARVRLRTQAAPHGWVKGVLVGADTGTIALVPEEAPPLGPNQLRLPSDSVTQLEVLTGRRRQRLAGLLIGAAVGVVMGVSEPVDPVRCQTDASTFCDRRVAVAAMTATSAFLGALVGSLVKTDVWTPVALDTLGPPPARSPRARLRVRPVPGGAAAHVSLSF
jgi:hypothetical protein